MEISVKTSITDAEKAGYLLKFLHALMTVLGFIVGYNKHGNYETGLLFACIAAIISITGIAGSGLSAIIIALAAAITAAITDATRSSGVLTITDLRIIAGTTAIIVAGAVTTADILICESNPKYRLSNSRNLISAITQFLLTWCLLYILK